MTKYSWTCEDCGTENDIAESVVELCSEHRAQCENDDCDNSEWFKFRKVR